MYCDSNIFNSHFINNRGDSGGALYADSIAAINQRGNYFTSNKAQVGEVLYVKWTSSQQLYRQCDHL